MNYQYYKKTQSSWFWRYFPFIIVLSLLGTLSVFLYWMFTVVVPVAGVELTYQTKRTLVQAFGVQDIRGLFLPSFKIGIQKTSKHESGGIVIPSLYLDEPIVFNVDPNDAPSYINALKKGIAHASSTRFPDTGGIGYYFAHSSSPSLARQYNAVFYLLGKLNGGETVYVWHEGKAYTYKITNKKVTIPEDISFLEPSQYTNETIVLQTCWPPGTTEKRLLVFAERVMDE